MPTWKRTTNRPDGARYDYKSFKIKRSYFLPGEGMEQLHGQPEGLLGEPHSIGLPELPILF